MKKFLLIISLFIFMGSNVFADKNIGNVFKIYSYNYDGLNDTYYLYSQGSAVLINDDTIITNAHVILNEENEVIGNYEICKTEDFKVNPSCFSIGELKYYDVSKDLAYLKLDKKVNHKGVVLSDESIEIGDNVKTYGYPGNGGGTISFTTGKISGFDLGKYKIDADIDSGSSGGAAFDSKGNLIGITSSVVVGYTTSGRIITINDIKDFLKKSGQLEYYNDGISENFRKYQEYLSLSIGKSKISNLFFGLNNIKKNKFNVIDVNTTNNRDVFRYSLESITGDTTIEIDRGITTGMNIDVSKILEELGEEIKDNKDIKFKYKEVILKGKKVYVILNVNKKTKSFKISFYTEGITFSIDGTLNNSKELNSALKLYFYDFITYDRKFTVDTISIGGIIVNKSDKTYLDYSIGGDKQYFTISGFVKYTEETIGKVLFESLEFKEEDIQKDVTMEDTLEYLKTYYSSEEDYTIFDSGVVKNSNNKVFGYAAVKSSAEKSIAYTIFAYNKHKELYQYSFFVISFDSSDKNIAKTVRNFIDLLDYEGESVIPVGDIYSVKSLRYIK